MTDTLRAALYSIPASCDRETWWNVTAALKTELGEAGFGLFDSWSQTAPDKGRRSVTASTWRSVHPGRFTAGTLYHEARQNGWQGREPVRPEPTPQEKRQAAEQRRREEQRAQISQRKAARRAHDMLLQATYVDPRPTYQNGHQAPPAHPYLVSKGFPQQAGLVLDSQLLVPMRHYRDYHRLQSVQMIGPDGSKKFLPRGKAWEAVYKIGKGAERYYCEGYATALSVRAALKRLYRDQHSEAWVCFSAGNIPNVAKSRRRSMVIADHDWWRCPKKECRAKWDYESKRCPSCGSSGVTEPAGEKHAKQTGLPYWIPDEPGTDANDVMLSHGVEALADVIREVHMTAMPRREVVA